VRPFLPDTFLPYGQVGVGIQSSLQAVVHGVRCALSQLCDNDSLVLLKIDVKNAFNKCNCTVFLDRVSEDFPEIACWVYWCISQPAELCFGHHRTLASTGVQQCDPLGPLLFSLVLLQFLDSTSVRDRSLLNLWYLDDGMFIGSKSRSRSCLLALYCLALLSLG